jgi:hypothetical protein
MLEMKEACRIATIAEGFLQLKYAGTSRTQGGVDSGGQWGPGIYKWITPAPKLFSAGRKATVFSKSGSWRKLIEQSGVLRSQ